MDVPVFTLNRADMVPWLSSWHLAIEAIRETTDLRLIQQSSFAKLMVLYISFTSEGDFPALN